MAEASKEDLIATLQIVKEVGQILRTNDQRGYSIVKRCEDLIYKLNTPQRRVAERGPHAG